LPLIALGTLVVVGVGLRVWLISAARPAFIGFPDAAWYMIAARDNVFVSASTADFSPWPAGYSIFLRLAHLPIHQLSPVILLQHLLGVATAVLLFLTVRRVAPAGWGLVPAAVVLLAGPQLFLEHSPMAETLFSFLLAALLYMGVRAYEEAQSGEDSSIRWSVAMGLLAAVSGTVRLVGLALIAIVVLWLLAGSRRSWRMGLRNGVAAALVAALVIGGYLGEMRRETGYGGPTLTQSGPSPTPADAGAPIGFAKRLAPDLVRFWSSDANMDNGGLNYAAFITTLVVRRDTYQVADISTWYATADWKVHAGAVDALGSYERHTRLEGLPLVLLVLLALGGIPLARDGRLAISLLAVGVAGAIMLGPLVYAQFDARYVVPGYGALAMAGALGAATLWERVARRVRRPQPTAAEALS
jgi:hypothetical protein